MAKPNLDFISRELDRAHTKLGAKGDELRVQGAICLRLNATVTTLLESRLC